MVEIPTAVVEIVQQFLALVEERQRVQAAYLYGSYARGTAGEWSDIDVAVISPDFPADRLDTRLALMRLAARIDPRIEPHPFTPDRFEPSDPLASEIQRTGVRLA
jgi:predicted nucleotidyltransferase